MECEIKILLLDIETAPTLAHVWSLFKQNVGVDQIIKSGYTLCWAAKWHGKREIFYGSVQQSTPRKMLTPIHALLSEADAVVTYNGVSFDLPTLRRDFLLCGLPPPPPSKQIDLRLVVKKQFRFVSGKLAHVGPELGIGKKVEHEGHLLWVRCINGDAAAWARMKRYNIGDVTLLESLYDRLLPWIVNHPNRGLHGAGCQCPNCGSVRLQRRGIYRTAVNRYQRMQCQDCGAWSRQGYPETGTAERRELLRSVA